jgi:hypothetical protein
LHHSLSRAGSALHSPPPLSVFDYSLLSFFFSFVRQFGFECCSLAQISSGIHYLPYFKRWLVVCPCSQPLEHFLCLFTELDTESLVHCPTSFLWGRFSIPPPSTVSVRLQFTDCFSALLGGGSVCPGVALVYVPGGWVRKSHVVGDVYWSFCQLTHRQVWSWWWQGEMAPTFLSAARCGMGFHGLGVQDVTDSG